MFTSRIVDHLEPSLALSVLFALPRPFCPDATTQQRGSHSRHSHQGHDGHGCHPNNTVADDEAGRGGAVGGARAGRMGGTGKKEGFVKL